MYQKIPQFSPEQLRQLASSPVAQRLAAMLQQDHGAAMDSAMASAQKGDMAAVQRAMATLLADPKAKAMLKKLQEERNG